MNHYDSMKIINHLNYFNKYKFIKSFYNSDIIILNMCSVRKKSEDKVFNYLKKINILKLNNNNLIVCICGCFSLKSKNIFLKDYDIINIIFSSKYINNLHFLINEYKKKKKKIIYINNYKNIYKSNIKDLYIKKNYFKNVKVYSYVSIMQGCNKYCSYCIVPFTKGKEISRSPEDIINEICYLSKNNIKEINLLGQNVNSYNSFFSNGNICKFSDLLYLISNIKDIERIRFTTSHPIDFKDDIINCYKNISKIVNYLHLPVQSGSDKILKLMGRKYNILYYKELVNKILSVRPNLTFSTDFIVGFPNESENDFILTLDLINEIKFDHSYIFMYSPRPGTKSYNYIDNIDMVEKKRRFFEIKKLIDKNVLYYNNKMLGNKYKILVEGLSKKNRKYLYGRTENNRKIFFLGNINLLGNLINIKIYKLKNNYLYGKLI